MYRLDIKRTSLENFDINEKIKSLRTNLELCGNDNKVLVFTSSIAGEGKSATSYQVAESFAVCGKRVLYIDGDMRRSSFKVRYKVREKNPGLSQYLSGLATLDEVIGVVTLDVEKGYSGQDKIHSIHVVQAGAVPPNPPELLENLRFEEMVLFARENYDYIIMDAPPVGCVIDPVIMAKKADGVVFVIRYGVIRTPIAQDAVKQLKRSKCRLLGIVCNRVPALGKNTYYRYG